MTLALAELHKSTPPQLRLALRQGDLLLAAGVLAILVVLILPLPAVVLDLCLALSVTLSVLILLTALTFVVGIVGSSLAPDAIVLVVFRVIIGLGVGSASVVVPLYIGELAPPHVRGALVSMNQLAITSGILISQLIAYFLTTTGQWRLMIVLAVIPSLVLGLGMIGLGLALSPKAVRR